MNKEPMINATINTTPTGTMIATINLVFAFAVVKD
jgi:hypothetical protein